MKISVVCDPHYHGDKLFDGSDASRNRDDCLRPWILLKNQLEQDGHEIHTADILAPQDADRRLYNEFDPRHQPISREGSILILLESPIIRREGWNQANWGSFERVLGWAPLPTEARYRKICIPYSSSSPTTEPCPQEARKLVCLISGNKESGEVGELYSERRKIIRWYEKNAPHDFDLYGIGWERGAARTSGLVRKVLEKLGIRWNKPFALDRGAVVSKLATLKKYRFCIAFENVGGYPGYITEKIFDPMMAGCIPVYRGAPDIGEHVPEGCFIDAREFPTVDSLARHLESLDRDTCDGYLEKIQTYLRSPAFQQFSPNQFSQAVMGSLLGNEQG